MSTGSNAVFTDPSTPNDPNNAIDQVLRQNFATLAGAGVFLSAAAGNDPGSGPDGVFIPEMPHSGQNGGSRGEYVLSLLVHPDDEALDVHGGPHRLPHLRKEARIGRDGPRGGSAQEKSFIPAFGAPRDIT